MTPTPPAEPQPQRVKPLAAAETAVRRFLLMIGFGFMAYVGGSMIASSIAYRIAARLEGSGDGLRMVVGMLTESAWILLALPAVSWVAARFLDVKPWSTAIIGASTGLFFQVALQYVSAGSDGLTADPKRQLARLVCAAAGIALTVIAVNRGRELARQADERAKLEAEKKRTQYDEFVQQAEALANRREAVPIAPPQPAATESPLPLRGEGQGEGTSEQKGEAPAQKTGVDNGSV